MLDNFERCFWIPNQSSQDKNHDIDTKCINRRGIYKDTYGSKAKFTDYQLRCNLVIAMSYAPELFNADNARTCLDNVA